MTLAQMGADVIRFDDIKGGLDSDRWPLTKDGASIYWAGLNKAASARSRSICATPRAASCSRRDHRAGRGGGHLLDQHAGARLARAQELRRRSALT